MLVIDGVELNIFHQPQQMRKFDADDTIRFQNAIEPTDEVVDVRHVRQHVVADDDIGGKAPGDEIGSRFLAEEPRFRGNADLPRHIGDVFGRFDAEHRHAGLDEMLEKVAVVARYLDHLRFLAETEALARHDGELAGMLYPAITVGGEVGVVAEDVFRRHEGIGLHQPALGADEGA